MKTIVSREELDEILYGENSVEPRTFVGTEYVISGDLLEEAKNNDNYIEYFFPYGDEGEYIKVDSNGYVVADFLYY